MFLAGADGKTPELRAASIKGAMRFWWRALNGHYLIDSELNKDILYHTGLRDQESFIFGGAGGGKGEGRSSFSIQVKNKALPISSQKLVPHKERGFMAEGFVPGNEFEVKFRLPKVKGEAYQVKVPIGGKKQGIFDRRKLIALFQLTCILGGYGRRVRRGMGSVQVVKAVSSKNGEAISVHPNPTLEEIHELVQVLSPHYDLQNSSARIQNVYTGRKSRYPWVSSIEIGRTLHNPTLLISQTTHELNAKDRRSYEPTMGHSYRGRFASPLVASVMEDKRVVVTTLNTIPDRDIPLVNLILQDEFKRKVL